MKKISYLIIAFTFLSCLNDGKNVPENFDFGTTENGLYTNNFFEVIIKFNPDWVIQSEQQMNNMIEKSGDLITGEDDELKKLVKASKVNTAYLLTIFKYEVGTTVDFNPSFLAIAENTNSSPDIKMGADYLNHVKKLLEQSPMQYYFDKDIYEKKIGKTTFHVMETKLDYEAGTIIQEYYSTIKNGFSLSFTASYLTEEQKEELYEIIDNIKI